MNLILALFLSLPQDYLNLLMEGKYDEAISYCDSIITTANGRKAYEWKLEKGDIYLDKMNDFTKASEIYQELIKDYPAGGGFFIFSKARGYPDLGWIYLRLAQSLEMNEDYLNAAKAYETVATKFRKFPLDSFALNGVERCFKKNYQDYVANVDGYNITRLELDERMAKGSRFSSKDEKSVLDQMILERLLYENAVKHKTNEADFFQKSIKDRRRSVLLEGVRNYDIVVKAIPTEKEMKQYYNKNKETYKLREESNGKEIVVESDSIARLLLDSLTKNTASFDTLAKLYSTAPSRHLGGNMGAVYRGTKSKPVEDVIFGAAVNKLTNIVPFDNKFGIYLITEHKPQRYQSFDEVKSRIETLLKSENVKIIEEKFLKNLRTSAKAEIHIDSTIAIEDTAGIQDKLLTTINGRQILWRDFIKRNESQPRFGQVNLLQSTERQKLLNTMVGEELQLEWAERHKYYLYDDYFTKMKDEIRNLMVSGLYMKIVADAVSVDSDAVKDYYNQHKEEFKNPETVRCQELVVNSRILAQDLRKTLVKDPAKFDSLAKEYSTAPTKTRGGDTGLIKKGMKPKKFEDAAFALKVGSVSKVFSMGDSSYTILKAIEYNPESYVKFDEIRSRIEAGLLRERQRKVADEFIKKIKEEADIKIFSAEPKKEE